MTDTAGNAGSAVVTITVGTTSQPTLVGSPTSQGKTWTATVANNGTVDVSGSWSPQGTFDCATISAGGSCSMSNISKKVASVTFTPTGGQPVVILKP